MLAPLKYWIMTNELAAVLVFRSFPNVCIIVLFKAKLNIAESAIPSIGNVYAPLIAGASLSSASFTTVLLEVLPNITMIFTGKLSLTD